MFSCMVIEQRQSKDLPQMQEHKLEERKGDKMKREILCSHCKAKIGAEDMTRRFRVLALGRGDAYYKDRKRFIGKIADEHSTDKMRASDDTKFLCGTLVFVESEEMHCFYQIRLEELPSKRKRK